MSQGTRGTMTGAHLGDHGACRRRSCSATAAPREGGRRRGHGDGRHHPQPVAQLFPPNSDRRVTLFPLPKLCSWTTPTASKAALAVEGQAKCQAHVQLKTKNYGVAACGREAQQMQKEALQTAARPRFAVGTPAVCCGCYRGRTGMAPGKARGFRVGPWRRRGRRGGGGRGRWTGPVDGAGGRAAGRTQKPENAIKPTKTPHTPIHRNKRNSTPRAEAARA